MTVEGPTDADSGGKGDSDGSEAAQSDDHVVDELNAVEGGGSGEDAEEEDEEDPGAEGDGDDGGEEDSEA